VLFLVYDGSACSFLSLISLFWKVIDPVLAGLVAYHAWITCRGSLIPTNDVFIDNYLIQTGPDTRRRSSMPSIGMA
jgi:hypothetical protein